MPLLRQGLVKGVLLTKASSPWAGNKSQSIQVSQCLHCHLLGLILPTLTFTTLRRPLPHQLLSIRMQMGVSHMWRGLSPQWHLLKYHLWNLRPGYLTGRLEELLILNRPCRPGEDVHDSVLPTSYWQARKTWEHTKKEIEAKATKAGVIWFVDEEAVEQRIWEIISRDEIAMNVTYQEAREHDNLKEGRATKRRRRDGPSSQAPMVSTKGT